MQHRHTKLLVAIGCSALLAVGAVVVIFAIGVRHVPDYPTLSERPDPVVTGRLAFIAWDAQNTRSCLTVQDVGGAARTLSCGWQGGIDLEEKYDVYPQWLGWDEDGHLLVAQYEPSQSDQIMLYTLDPETGDELARAELPTTTRPPDPTRRDDGARVGTTWSDNGTAEVWVREADGGRRVLWRDRGPDGYMFMEARWSTRGDFVLVLDSEGRWIVLATDGDPTPRILLRDEGRQIQQLTWYEPA